MNARNHIRSIAAPLAIAVLVGAVGVSAQQAAPAPSRPKVDAHQPVLQVANHNWLDVHVYVSREGGPLMPLGIVGSNQSVELAFPRGSLDMGGAIRVVADPIGGNGLYVSPEVVANADDAVVVTIENALPLSFTSVRPRVLG